MSISTATAPDTALHVLIVDDQAAVRAGLRRLLASASLPLFSVRTAATRDEALGDLALAPPDLLILDVDLAGDDGLALIAHCSRRTQVLVLTSHGDAATRARARRLGAAAFVEKQAPATELVAALRRMQAARG